jgi:hypothetical protein
MFWLLQGERDGDADEVEGLALFAGGLGEHGDGRAGAGEPDLVAGETPQVGEQAAEAAVGAACGVVLSSVMVTPKCLAVLYLLITLPTAQSQAASETAGMSRQDG